MTLKPVHPRRLASQDVEEAITHYLKEGAEAAAMGFIDALESAYLQISRHPAAGSPRYDHELNLPGMRCWRLKHYPYLIFYMELKNYIDVWRILHAQRDIPGWMAEP